MKLKNVFLSFLIILMIHGTASAQQVAVTEEGDSVVLFSDMTWIYLSDYIEEDYEEKEITFNENSFEKPASATAKITESDGAYTLWYDNKAWMRHPAESINPDADFVLKFKNGDAYGMLIYEELTINIELIADLALRNANMLGGDMQLDYKEYRVLNNDTIICMKMDGEIQGVNITYFSYYLSNDKGTVQFHTFTGTSIFDKYREEMEELLNGIVF